MKLGVYENDGCEKNVSISWDGNGTKYTDIVDIDAGWKTVFVYLWAVCFYSHRQKEVDKNAETISSSLLGDNI